MDVMRSPQARLCVTGALVKDIVSMVLMGGALRQLPAHDKSSIAGKTQPRLVLDYKLLRYMCVYISTTILCWPACPFASL